MYLSPSGPVIVMVSESLSVPPALVAATVYVDFSGYAEDPKFVTALFISILNCIPE